MSILATIGDCLTADIRLATPILFGALGLLIVNRSGMLNIGCEGIMLISALMAVIGSYYTGSVWLGFLFAMICGAILGLFFAWLTVSLRANQIVIGQALNLLGLGVSTTLFRVMFGTEAAATPNISTFQNISIPFLSDIPVLGNALFNQMPPVYIAFALVPLISFFLFHTQPGLDLRSVGENPQAADTMGINVYGVRYAASMLSGALMAAGGAFLSTGLLRFFSEDMVSGRGFIAIAAVIFGRYKPAGLMLATLLFAAGNVVANTLPALGIGIPYNFLVIIPYLLTILAMTGITGHVVPPVALGKPYKKG